MPERQIDPGLALLAQTLVDEWRAEVSGPLAELAHLLRNPSPVRSVPSDRVATYTWEVPTGNARQLIGFQLDRARVTIRNSGPVTVSLGSDETITPTSSTRVDLPAGDAITVDTRAEWWFIAAAAGGQVALIVEQWDP